MCHFGKENAVKIIVINGSPRKNGLTASILHSVEEELISQGNDVEYVDLTDLDIGHCRGCCSCYKTGHCHMDDGAELLSEKIRHADGLVLGSPTYASNVSGLMKDLIDRGHFVIEQLLTGKRCMTVVTGENYGCKNAGKVLNDLILFSGGILCARIALKAPFNGRDCQKEKIRSLSKRAALRMVRKKTDILQSLYHRIIFNFGIRPFVKRKGGLYKGVTVRWSEMGIG